MVTDNGGQADQGGVTAGGRLVPTRPCIMHPTPTPQGETMGVGATETTRPHPMPHCLGKARASGGVRTGGGTWRDTEGEGEAWATAVLPSQHRMKQQ